MKRLTKKISKTIQDKYSLGSYSYYDFADTKDTKQLLNKLGELEDVLEKWHIENLEGYISALIEARNIAIDEKKNQFKKYIEEVAKRENLEQELAELKQKAIVPKFKIGQEIYYIYCSEICSMFVSTIEISTNYIIYHSLRDFVQLEDNCFETKEEAEQKLAKIKGEKDE